MSMETLRASPAITLNFTCNQQGGVYFLSLTTGKRVSRHIWTELPMDKLVFEDAHDFAFAEPFFIRDVMGT